MSLRIYDWASNGYRAESLKEQVCDPVAKLFRNKIPAHIELASPRIIVYRHVNGKKIFLGEVKIPYPRREWNIARMKLKKILETNV